MSFLLLTTQPGRARAVFFTLVLLATGCVRYLGAQCTEGWQTPRVLEAGDGRPAYVESPIAMPSQGGVLLLGVPAFLWAERDAFDPFPSSSALDTAAYLARLRKNIGMIGFLLGRDNTAIPVWPPFPSPMRRLVAVSGTDGTIHVAWFSPPPGSSDSDAEGTVWYAERQGDHWTVPTMVFSADRLDWSRAKAALLIAHNSEIHLVVPYYKGNTSGIAHIRRTNGRWTTTETTLGGLPSQVTAQFMGTDSLAVAFARVGAPGVRVRNGQHVFQIRAALSDTVWPAPTLVHYSGLAGVRWLRMYTLPSTNRTSEVLTLVWDRFSRDDRTSADTVYAMVSGGAGAPWRTAQMLILPFKVTTLTQDRDSKGNVHVVVTSWDHSGAKNAQLYHAAFTQGGWTGVDSLLAGALASVPTLSSVGHDTMLVAWGTARPASAKLPGPIAPVSEYATYVSACPRSTRR
jgi:hypothetical protein